MAIAFQPTSYPGQLPAFWRGEAKVLPGDFKLKQTFAEGDVIPRGTPIALDFDLMQAGVCRVAKVVAGGTTSAPRIVKGSLITVGTVLMKIGKTDVSPSVTAIDKTNASYDTLTLSAAITGLAAGDYLEEASAYIAAINAVNETKGVYTGTISTAPSDTDKITVAGVVYEFATTPAEGKVTIGESATTAAAALKAAIDGDAALAAVFTITTTGATIVFTQKVGGTGAVPQFEADAAASTLVAAIVTTTPGVAAVTAADAVPAAALYTADAVVETPYVYSANGFQTVSAAYEAVVLKGHVYPVPPTWLEGFSLANNHSIKYINQ